MSWRFKNWVAIKEITEPEEYEAVQSQKINRQGLAHIAFRVDAVEECLKAVFAEGGSKLSDIIRKNIPGVGNLTFVYAKDPEGNFIELQKLEIER